MNKTTLTAIAAAMIAFSPMAYAQTAATGAAHVSTATQMTPTQIRASKFIGSTVYDVQNRNIGE